MKNEKKIWKETDEAERLLANLLRPKQTLHADERWLEEDETALFDQLMVERNAEGPSAPTDATQRHMTIGTIRRIVITALSAAAVIVGAFFATRPLLKAEEGNMSVTYINGNKVVNERLALDMMQETLCDVFDRPDVSLEISDLLK